MAGVLVLNADLSVLAFVDWQRAVTLLVQTDANGLPAATVFEADPERVVRSPSTTVPLPRGSSSPDDARSCAWTRTGLGPATSRQPSTGSAPPPGQADRTTPFSPAPGPRSRPTRHAGCSRTPSTHGSPTQPHALALPTAGDAVMKPPGQAPLRERDHPRDDFTDLRQPAGCFRSAGSAAAPGSRQSSTPTVRGTAARWSGVPCRR